MTGEQLYHSALLLMGESTDSLGYHEAALSALSLLCAKFALPIQAYHTAYGSEAALTETVHSFSQEICVPFVIVPCFVYGLAAELCRTDRQQLSETFDQKCEEILNAFWETLPAKVHSIRETYSV